MRQTYSQMLRCALVICAVVTSISCSGGDNPIVAAAGSSAAKQLLFATGVVARFNGETGKVCLGAPPNTALAGSLVTLTVDGNAALTVRAFYDGSFFCQFDGNGNSQAAVSWVNPSGTRVERTVHVTRPCDFVELAIDEVGLYPNRIVLEDSLVWVVNSGLDELATSDSQSLSGFSTRVELPRFSNPWEVAFSASGEGIVTTLFGGVFSFDSAGGSLAEVRSDGFRDFASPNGCVFAGEKAWVANPNPVSYFPTVMGPGWLSVVETGTNPHVAGEVNTAWLNPQNVITDGKYVYVSCSGTIDFAPPDYTAVALDSGGVQVIDAGTQSIVASYELGRCGPGPMALSPGGRFLYVGSGVAGWLLRIDLRNGKVLNDADNPIVVSDFPGTFVSFVEVSREGLLVCGDFNTDTLHFVDSRTGELNPFPYFEDVCLREVFPDSGFLGVQDGALCSRYGKPGLLVLTSVQDKLFWLAL